jgi:hypothetical protein
MINSFFAHETAHIGIAKGVFKRKSADVDHTRYSAVQGLFDDVEPGHCKTLLGMKPRAIFQLNLKSGSNCFIFLKKASIAQQY